MKIAILGDTHFGARNRNITIEKWQRKFYEEYFWPTIDDLGIRQIIQVGDYFDSRKWLNIQTIAFQKDVFVNQAQKRDVNVDVLVGNHDIPFRHSLKNNSPMQILGHEPNFTVYEKPTTCYYHDKELVLMPWICKENYDECMNVIRQGGDTIIGHFEIKGFLMHPGSYSKDGLTRGDFSKWKNVISGHYHSQSKDGNIHYTGTPYQMMWSDCGGKHGFWIYDTDTGESVFKKNPFDYYYKIEYDDDFENSCLEEMDLKDAYVKVNVKEKADFVNFEKFIDTINFHEPFELKINESFEEYSSDNVKEIIELSETTDIISEYIDDVATANNKEEIKKIMISIYEEALHLDDNV